MHADHSSLFCSNINASAEDAAAALHCLNIGLCFSTRAGSEFARTRAEGL
jgi:hypothetical protein